MKGIEHPGVYKHQLLPAAVFMVPLWKSGCLIALALLAIARLMSPLERAVWWREIRRPGLHWILPLFFMIHVAGLLWSSNLKFGFRDLETKLSLLLFPLLLCGLDDQDSWKNIRRAFVNGCLAAAVFLLAMAIKSFMESGKGIAFFYVGFSSPLMHPTYLSMLINLGLVFLIQELQGRSDDMNSGWVVWIKFIFLWFILVLLSSRMSFLVSLITCSGLTAWLFMRKNLPGRIAVALAGCIMTALAGMFTANMYTGRVNEFGQSLGASSDQHSSASFNSTTGRLEIWRQVRKLLPEVLPMGTGTGDVKDALMESYRSNDFNYGLEKSLNAHNQYLQTVLALGIPGLASLLLFVFSPLVFRRINRDPAVTCFFLVIGLNALAESILEVQRGVVMTALFAPLLMSGDRKHKTEE